MRSNIFLRNISFLRRFGGVLAMIVAGAVLVGCDDRAESQESEWYKDELLTQIKELKSDIKLLREQIERIGEKADPKPDIVQLISLAGAPSLADDASIAIVEFSDFQCPYCARHDQKVFSELKEKYIDSGKLRYVARDFPLGFHAQARPAAMAAHCAGDQDKYWEMRHFLFASNGLNDARYEEGADTLGLDQNVFTECMITKKYADRVENDFIYGQRVGVNGTPRFFIGRVKGDVIVDVVPLSGAQPFSTFENVIENFLQ